MHFSVPDTQELVDEAGNAFTGYNVHINGLYHCTVRYKQLHHLYEQLTKAVDKEVKLPPFPPKKYFSLTVNQQEDRRLCLDRFIQAIGQNKIASIVEHLNNFLLCAQLESADCLVAEESVEIFYINGKKIDLVVTAVENSGQLLKKLFKQIGLEEKFCSYFSLFIVYQDEENFVVLRKLQNFESPIITLKNIHKEGARIVVGKWYWNIAYDLDLLHNSVASNLLYSQVTAEIERGWIPIPEEILHKLHTLQSSNDEQKYLETIRSLRYYGYMQFSPCICDYPQPGSKVILSIGKNELIIRVTSLTHQLNEIEFKVTRMRCWRITTQHEENDRRQENNGNNLELSFEYLMSKDNLQWITISSDQAILMSVCLQSMIDELTLRSIGGIEHQEVDNKTWTYVTRDGHNRTISGPLTPEIFKKEIKENGVNTHKKADPIIKIITERFAAATTKKSSPVKSPIRNQDRSRSTDGDLMENNAFRMIGDDDL